MQKKKRKGATSTPYAERLQGWIHQYRNQLRKGRNEIDLDKVAEWAIAKGLWEPKPVNPVRQLARDLARAARQEYFENEQGKPVRRIHAYKVKRGDVQQTFRFMMEDGTPQQMRMSAGARRRGILSDCLQLNRDVNYFNSHYNPGDEIQLSLNFEPDRIEDSLPTEYPDAPPPDEEGTN